MKLEEYKFNKIFYKIIIFKIIVLKIIIRNYSCCKLIVFILGYIVIF